MERHKGVAKVVYPGLKSHPQHEIATRQQHGFGAMITFYCVGKRAQSAIMLQNVSIVYSLHGDSMLILKTILTFLYFGVIFLSILIKYKIIIQLRVFALAESLGAVESLAECPSLMTHASVPDEQRALLGIDDTLIRLSVGIENCSDLIADLDSALNAALCSLE